jgi:hypothetical protein
VWLTERSLSKKALASGACSAAIASFARAPLLIWPQKE